MNKHNFSTNDSASTLMCSKITCSSPGWQCCRGERIAWGPWTGDILGQSNEMCQRTPTELWDWWVIWRDGVNWICLSGFKIKKTVQTGVMTTWEVQSHDNRRQGDAGEVTGAEWAEDFWGQGFVRDTDTAANPSGTSLEQYLFCRVLWEYVIIFTIWRKQSRD